MLNESLTQPAEDRYYTQIEAGDVRLFTLDQLDAAFNAGLIDESTHVRLEGDSRWQTLADAAGLGADANEPGRTLPGVGPALPSAAPDSISPVVAAAREVARTSVDVDAQLEILLKRPRKGLRLFAALAALALGCGGLVLLEASTVHLPSPTSSEEVARASAATLRLPAATSTPLPGLDVVEGPAPIEKKAIEAQGPEAAAAHDTRLSEEAKEGLRARDRKLTSVLKAKHTRSVKHRPASKATKTLTFKSGGSAYDPLNGKL